MPLATTWLGFHDDEHTALNGESRSFVTELPVGGFFIGRSNRYSGPLEKGVSVWDYSPATGETRRLGIFDSLHTRGSEQVSEITTFIEEGLVAGRSARYHDSELAGYTAWVTQLATGQTRTVGLSAEQYLEPDGHPTSEVSHLTESHAAGSTLRRGNDGDVGSDTWVANLGTGTTLRVGLYDAEHTNSGGVSQNGITTLGLDYVLGTSKQFVADSAFDTPWVASVDTGVTYRAGLHDAEHTGADGRQSALAWNTIVADRYVVGSSTRFEGNEIRGVSAWYTNAETGQTTRVGLHGDGFRSDNGSETSRAIGTVGSGFLYGESYVHVSGVFAHGTAAWIASLETGETTRVGFYDASHTWANGLQSSSVVAVNSSGVFIGNSSKERGKTAWFATVENPEAVRIGLYDAEHTGSVGEWAGVQSNTALTLSEAGLVVGTARGGSSLQATSIWAYDVNTGLTRRFGLLDADHLTPQGYDSRFRSVTSTGWLAGYSKRAVGGESAWVGNWSSGETIRVGLYDTRHTNDVGESVNEIVQVTDNGRVFGTSARFPTGEAEWSQGKSVWVQDVAGGGTVKMVGLHDAAHEDSGGFAFSEFTHITESGDWAAGFSVGLNDSGSTAWVYSVLRDETISFTFDLGTDGYSYSRIDELLDEGVARGHYAAFDEMGFELGMRPFLWIDGVGAFVVPGDDLAFVNFDPDDFQLVQLESGEFALIGNLENNNLHAAVLLTAVPEPGIWALLLVAGAGWGCARIVSRKKDVRS